MGKMKELAMEEQQRQQLGTPSDAGFEIDQLRKSNDEKLNKIVDEISKLNKEMDLTVQLVAKVCLQMEIIVKQLKSKLNGKKEKK